MSSPVAQTSENFAFSIDLATKRIEAGLRLDPDMPPFLEGPARELAALLLVAAKSGMVAQAIRERAQDSSRWARLTADDQQHLAGMREDPVRLMVWEDGENLTAALHFAGRHVGGDHVLAQFESEFADRLDAFRAEVVEQARHSEIAGLHVIVEPEGLN